MAHPWTLVSALIDLALFVYLFIYERRRARQQHRPIRRALMIVLVLMGVTALWLVVVSFIPN